MKKLLLSLVALLGVSAVAMAQDNYEAALMVNAAGWWPTVGSDSGYDADAGHAVMIAGNGTYTITTSELAGTNGLITLCVDIVDILADYSADDLTVKLISIVADGVEVEFDADKVLYGNLEDNNDKYRIEIYNDYGSTANDSPIDQDNFVVTETLSVTFSIAGLATDNAISDIQSEDAVEVARYNIVGQILSAPEKGINIVKYSDGTSKKELVK